MKKTVISILVLILLAVLCASLFACTTNDSYFTFAPNADESGYVITGTAKILPDKVTLPNTYQGKPVTKATLESKTVKEITIPKNIDKIRLNCSSLESIKIAKDSDNFVVDNNVLYTSDMRVLVFVLPTKQDDLVVPRTLIAAEQWAFSCSNFKEVFIPTEYLDYAIDNLYVPYDFYNKSWNSKGYSDGWIYPLSSFKKVTVINIECNYSDRYLSVADSLYRDRYINWGVPMPS